MKLDSTIVGLIASIALAACGKSDANEGRAYETEAARNQGATTDPQGTNVHTEEPARTPLTTSERPTLPPVNPPVPPVEESDVTPQDDLPPIDRTPPIDEPADDPLPPIDNPIPPVDDPTPPEDDPPTPPVPDEQPSTDEMLTDVETELTRVVDPQTASDAIVRLTPVVDRLVAAKQNNQQIDGQRLRRILDDAIARFQTNPDVMTVLQPTIDRLNAVIG